MAALEVANCLAAELRAGGELKPIATSLRLDAGEVAYFESWAWLSQYFATDGTYRHTSFVAGGGAGLVALTAGISAIGNVSRQRAATAMAAPQWRPLGAVPLVATDRRLLACDQGRWLSWWYTAVRQFVPYIPHHLTVDLLLDEGRPTRFAGAPVASLAVILARLLYGETLCWTAGPAERTPLQP